MPLTVLAIDALCDVLGVEHLFEAHGKLCCVVLEGYACARRVTKISGILDSSKSIQFIDGGDIVVAGLRPEIMNREEEETT